MNPDAPVFVPSLKGASGPTLSTTQPVVVSIRSRKKRPKKGKGASGVAGDTVAASPQEWPTLAATVKTAPPRDRARAPAASSTTPAAPAAPAAAAAAAPAGKPAHLTGSGSIKMLARPVAGPSPWPPPKPQLPTVKTTGPLGQASVNDEGMVQKKGKKAKTPKPSVVDQKMKTPPAAAAAAATVRSTVAQSTLPAAQVQRRGLERERPKAKRPTKIKRAILSERRQRNETMRDYAVRCAVNAIVEGAWEVIRERHGWTDDGDKESDKDKNEEEGEDDSCAAVSTLLPESFYATSKALRQRGGVVHSRRFREYCTQLPNGELDTLTRDVLARLWAFQKRKMLADPVKARMRRRLVRGLRELTKLLNVTRTRVKVIFLARDVERNATAGGLDETIAAVLSAAEERDVPVVFALTRKALGLSIGLYQAVSVIGVLDFDGVNEPLKRILEMAHDAHVAYRDKTSGIEEGAPLTSDPNSM